MKKKFTIKVPKINILKESPEERKERVRNSGSAMITKIVPIIKKPTKMQQRQRDLKELNQW